MEKYEEVERTIIKTYRSSLWSKFVKALKEYDMLKPNDKVCVCISGGKDSMLLAKLFQELQKHSDFPFEAVYLLMNPGYSEQNLDKIKANLKLLNIPAVIKETNIFQVAKEKSMLLMCKNASRCLIQSCYRIRL